MPRWNVETKYRTYDMDGIRITPREFYRTMIEYDDGFFYIYGEGNTKEESLWNAFRQLSYKAQNALAKYDYDNDRSVFGNLTILSDSMFVLWGCVYEANDHNGKAVARDQYSGRLYTLDNLGVCSFNNQDIAAWFQKNQDALDGYNRSEAEWETSWIDGPPM